MDTYRHTLPPRVASELRAARLALPWSLTSLAAVVGISRGHLIRIQNGTRAPSSIVAMILVPRSPPTANVLTERKRAKNDR